DHERLGVTGAVAVGSAGGAVARGGARHGGDPGEPARVQGARAGHLDRLAPGAVRLADHERLEAAGAVGVAPAGGAVGRRAARHGEPAGPPGVRAAGPGLPAPPPRGAFGLAHHAPGEAGAAGVGPAGGAVARRAARHRGDLGKPARVQDPRPGYLDRVAPGAVRLADREGLEASGTIIVTADGGAVACRGSRHRGDPGVPALVAGYQAMPLDHITSG